MITTGPARTQMIDFAPITYDAPAGVTSVRILMTCHNRRETTLSCIGALENQSVDRPISASLVLVDDGSRDGTAEAVLSHIPNARIVRGDGHLFWGGAMALAQQTSTTGRLPMFLLWLNDDVKLYATALHSLLETSRNWEDAIVVGPVQDSERGATSYSGLQRHGRSPLQLEPITPTGEVQFADTFNGNVVLVPQSAYARLGTVDPAFPHLYGDLDYGYRARAGGIPIVVAPKHVGACTRNDESGTWRDPALPFARRFTAVHSAKVMPLVPRLRFVRRHGGPEWPVRLLSGYVKAYWAILRKRGNGR
jgi:GT2 family glycosyltransferase